MIFGVRVDEVRSIGAFTTEEDVNTAIEAVKEIAAIRN